MLNLVHRINLLLLIIKIKNFRVNIDTTILHILVKHIIRNVQMIFCKLQLCLVLLPVFCKSKGRFRVEESRESMVFVHHLGQIPFIEPHYSGSFYLYPL